MSGVSSSGVIQYPGVTPVSSPASIPAGASGVYQMADGSLYSYKGSGQITKLPDNIDGSVHVNIAKNIARTFRTNQGAANVQESHIFALEIALSPLLASSAWPKIRELWVPLGVNLTGALTKIKYPTGNLAALANTGTFLAANYDPYVGLTGNGTTMYLSSDANPTTLGMTNKNLGIAAHTTSSTWTGALTGVAPLLYTGLDFASGSGYGACWLHMTYNINI